MKIRVTESQIRHIINRIITESQFDNTNAVATELVSYPKISDKDKIEIHPKNKQELRKQFMDFYAEMDKTRRQQNPVIKIDKMPPPKDPVDKQIGILWDKDVAEIVKMLPKRLQMLLITYKTKVILYPSLKDGGEYNIKHNTIFIQALNNGYIVKECVHLIQYKICNSLHSNKLCVEYQEHLIGDIYSMCYGGSSSMNDNRYIKWINSLISSEHINREYFKKTFMNYIGIFYQKYGNSYGFTENQLRNSNKFNWQWDMFFDYLEE